MIHARLVQDWLEGWNTRNLDLLMSHYAADAVFISPAVLVAEPGSSGSVRGEAAIRELYRRRLEHSPETSGAGPHGAARRLAVGSS